MMVSDCCDSIPYNDIIHEAYGNHYGMCGECREHCGFYDDSIREHGSNEDMISPNDPGDENIDKDVHDHPLGVGFGHKDTKKQITLKDLYRLGDKLRQVNVKDVPADDFNKLYDKLIPKDKRD